MALLTGTGSRTKKSKPSSSEESRPSSSPQSLPDVESWKRIESLEQELAATKASAEASKAEIAHLKRQLAGAQANLATPPQVHEVSPQNEREERKSFFGV